MALWRITTDGGLELANSFSYATWGQPTITGSHPNSANAGLAYGDLGFRFLYVGEFDVQWDSELGLGLLYMHARHYSPSLGRFLQPDPDRSEANLYGYAANNPVTEIDPDGTCFIVCAIVGAVVNVAIYAATTDSFDLGEAAKEAVIGGVTGFTGVGLISRFASGAKLLAKISKATRVLSRPVAAARGKVASLARRVVANANNNDYVRFGTGWMSNRHVKPRYWPKDPDAVGQVMRRIAIGSDRA